MDPPFSQDFCIRIMFGMLNDGGMTISHQAVPPSDPSSKASPCLFAFIDHVPRRFSRN